MHSQKLNNILKLETEDRYWYSIREFAKLEKIWAVSTPEGWITFFDKEGDEIFPIWPHKEVAEICVLDELKLAGFSVESIDYDKFVEYCIADMKESNVLFGVFYNTDREALTVLPDRLKDDLEEEMEG